MTLHQIKRIFTDSKIIKSESALDKYLDFINTHKLDNHIKHKTAYHHIIPKAKNLPIY